MSTMAANISLLAKVMDQEILQIIMKVAICLLVQVNVPERFLQPMEDKRPKTTEEKQMAKVEKTVLPRLTAACLRHEPKHGPTEILAAAVQELQRRPANYSTFRQNNSLMISLGRNI